MANTKELSVEDKLRAIYDLQLIDSRIDEIRNVRGELPLEVEDLEDEVAGLSTRSDKLKSELEVIEDLIRKKRMQLTSTKRLSKVYKTTGNCKTIENLTFKLKLKNCH
jgi:predicted  nucleic acid-binding Zn-ribbon protein